MKASTVFSTKVNLTIEFFDLQFIFAVKQETEREEREERDLVQLAVKHYTLSVPRRSTL